MDTSRELQARIAALSGQINRHKQSQQTSQPDLPKHTQLHSTRNTQYPHTHHGRWSPYKPGIGAQYHNRKLVLNNESTASSDNEAATDNGGYVKTMGRNNQLMTKATLDRERELRQNTLQRPVSRERARTHVAQEGARPLNSPASRELVFDGIRFTLQSDGSKLVRADDLANVALESPRRVNISGIDFYRTKKGNLARAKQQHRYTPRNESAVRETGTSSHVYRNETQPRKRCETFTRLGSYSTLFNPTLSFWPLLPSDELGASWFAHDARKIAICKDFLRSGKCNAGEYCDLSHEINYHRVPACTHFLRGNCTNSACRYAHVNVPHSAFVCRPFAMLGYCSKGLHCDKRHVFECPDYANKGHCVLLQRGKCALPHVDRAGILRRKEKQGSADESDLSDDEQTLHDELDSNDREATDSDGFEEDMTMLGSDDTHSLTQQEDFVSFS